MTNSGTTFEQEGNAVVSEIGRISAATDELNSENGRCADEPQEVGNWITAIGKALLAIFGVGASGAK